MEIKLDSSKVNAALQRLSHATADMSPAMQIIAGVLDDAVHENFAQQGRPKWLGLSPTTQKIREKKGHWPGSILQQSGRLRNDIGTESGVDYAKVGVKSGLASKYAAMMQFGGKTSPRSMIPNKTIAPRPFLKLTEADEDKIVGVVNNYLRSVIA